jgi:serine/threonine protein kinase
MAALDHPNIVHAYDCDQDDKVHYIVLEYVDGISLSALVKKRGPLPVERAVNYICQAALGLQHAHECGLVHRDIKPGNMLLDRQGLVKILDMGLARLFHDHADNLTLEHNAGRALGTADYLAPEQVANSHDVDPRADIYSLGASLYFLLVGKAPFQGATISQKLILHQIKAPTPLRQLRPEIPEELVAIITRMMAKMPQERYTTADEACAALQPWAGPAEMPTELPQPCPAILQMIQQYMPPTARKMVTGQAARPASSATAVAPTVPATASSISSPAPLAPAGSAASPKGPSAARTPSGPGGPSRRLVRMEHLERLGETPLAGSLFQTETDAQGRPVPTAPAPLPKKTSEELFGNWGSDLSRQNAPPRNRRWRTVLLIAGMLLLGGVGGIAGNLFLQGSISGDSTRKTRFLTPTEAANHVDEARTVELRVRSVNSNRGNPPVIFLHSESDWKTPGNFTVILTNAAVEQLRQDGVEDFVAHFKDHKVRATGTIQLYKDRTSLKQHRLQMMLDDPTSLQMGEP